jgi:ATP-dependent helicase/nuclease subunit A
MPKKLNLSIEQTRATEPTMNIVVQANAGTGKTFILVQRLLRILFREYNTNNDKPSGILCLTYTNAGASEMQSRVLAAVMEWAKASDEELRDLLSGISHSQIPTDNDLQIARNIFYFLIDNPHAIKIQTIHSFCEDILRRFSIEANVPSGWRLVSGSEQKRILKESLSALMHSHDERILNAFDNVLDDVSEYSLDGLLESILEQYKHILMQKLNSNSPSYIIDKTRYFLGLDRPVKRPDDYENKGVYLTATGTIRKNLKSDIASHAQQIYEYDQYEQNMDIFKTSENFLLLCNAFADEYIAIKNKRGLLDFDDLLHKTLVLFSNPQTMGRVLSELDFDLKHILVDEAQDNSPTMWSIIFSMLDDFFTNGEGANPRSLFVVGDTKQSIFSFQGASPQTFENISSRIDLITKNKQRQYETVPLLESRRTTASVLGVVDYFFNNAHLPEFPENIKHKCWRHDEFGMVEVYPEFKQNEDEKLEITRKRYIKFISDKIESLIKNGEAIESDIMVLVQRRNPFADLLSRELKKRNIQTAGSDRIILSEFPAVRDLLNLIRFAVNPDDDAALAFVLRSPICKLTESELLDIAKDRRKSLFSEVSEKRPDIYKDLSDIISISNLPPYSFFSKVMGKYRHKIISALGKQVIEPLDEFITLSLSFERTKPGGLVRFLRWFLDGENEIKRDMEKGAGIRVLTTHSSKGLEAPFVFLIDTTKNPKSQTKQKPLNVLRPEPDVFISKIGDTNSEKYSVAKDIDLHSRTSEYWRLFYVAMTRARDRLYVFGCPEKSKNDSWHSRLYEVVKDMPDATVSDSGIIIVQNGTKNNAKIAAWQILTDSGKPLTEQQNSKVTLTIPVTLNNTENSAEKDVDAFMAEYNKRFALSTGTDVHKKLQFLDLNSDDEMAVKIKNDSFLSEFWGTNAHSEFPIAGTIDGKFYSFRIDRILVKESDVLFLDYKTDLNKDRTPEYREKLGKYTQLLKQIFPNKNISAYILWLHNWEIERIN